MQDASYGNNHAEPPPLLVQCPDTVAVEPLNNERDGRIHRNIVYRREAPGG